MESRAVLRGQKLTWLGFRHFQNNLPKRRPGAAVSRLSHSVMKAVFQR
jgi:hypothetical protein